MKNGNNKKSDISDKVIDLKPNNGKNTILTHFGQYSPDEDLIQSTARIKNQRDVIKDRLQKMDEAHSRVSKTVYEKVRRDYSLQLNTITELLNDKKLALKEEIKKLYMLREKLNVEVNRHKEILEEAEFRHFLGEFDLEQFQEVETFESKEVEHLEVDLENITKWIKTHEELFDPEDFDYPKAKRETQDSRQDQTTAKQENIEKAETHEENVAPVQENFQQTEKSTETITTVTPETEQKRTETVTIATGMNQSAELSKHSSLAEDLAILKAQKQSQTQEEQIPTTDNTESKQNAELSDFDNLFSEEEDEEQIKAINESQSNIQALINGSLKDIDTTPASEEENTPKPSQQFESSDEEVDSLENYFAEEQVDESSFNLSPEEAQAEINPGESFTQPKAKITEEQNVQTKKESLELTLKHEDPDQAQEDTNPAARNPEQEKANIESEISENSISEILDSIKLEGEDEEEAHQAAQEASHKTKPGQIADYKLIVTQGQLDHNEYQLFDNTSIGRSPSNDIMLKEPKVSRQHAAINKYNEHYIIIDLKSSNGVYVNGAKIDECVLHPGDEVAIGGYKFTFTKNQ